MTPISVIVRYYLYSIQTFEKIIKLLGETGEIAKRDEDSFSEHVAPLCIRTRTKERRQRKVNYGGISRNEQNSAYPQGERGPIHDFSA